MVSNKFILHYGNLAGWPYQFAKGLRDVGYDSTNVMAETADVEDLDRRLPFDRTLHVGKPSKIVSIAKRAAFFASVANKVGLVHYHSGVILPARMHPMVEGAIFQKLDVPMVMTFGGGEARIISQARALTPYFYLQPDEKRDAWTRNSLATMSKRIRFVATDCEMATFVKPYFEKVFTLRQPVDLAKFPFVEPEVDRPPVFLHIPTHAWAKGTKYILAAVERLKSEGYRFEFRTREKLTQAQMYSELAACDVYVDELLCGAHGVTAVEAMATGKPAITYIRPDLVSQYPPDLPLVNANPDTIYEMMRCLISEPSWRRQLSYDGRAYAEKYHDAKLVVQDLISMYREIGWKG